MYYVMFFYYIYILIYQIYPFLRKISLNNSTN